MTSLSITSLTQKVKSNGSLVLAISALSVSLVLSACAATTTRIDPDTETHYDASYDFSDKKEIVDALTGSLLSSVNTESPTKPIVIVYGVANETSEHINTGGITDDIRNALIKSGEYRFINRIQRENIMKEMEFQQAGYVAPEQQVEVGRQLGADYILSGTLRSIEKKQPRQWRLNKKKLIYYSMNLEMTNLTTGEISWADDVEIARESSQPILRW